MVMDRMREEAITQLQTEVPSIPSSPLCQSPIEFAAEEEGEADGEEEEPMSFAEISALIQSGKTHLIPNNKPIPEGVNVFSGSIR